MIKECFIANTGILFDDKYLKEVGLDLEALIANPASVDTTKPEAPTLSTKDTEDAVAPLYNQLVLVPYWWVLELIPLLGTFQQEDGSWLRQRRYIYLHPQ
jgi:hypothetical protein